MDAATHLPVPAQQALHPNKLAWKGVGSREHPCTDDTLIIDAPDNFDLREENGVKGKIKNYSGQPVRVEQMAQFQNLSRYECTLQNNAEVTYYNSLSAKFRFSASGKHTRALKIYDNYLKRAVSLDFYSDAPLTESRANLDLKTGDTHDFYWDRTYLWVKMEGFDWNGGHDRPSNQDWAVVTIHVKSV